MILIRFLAILPLFTYVESQVVRIGLGSCAHQDSSQGIWKAVLGWEPDIFLHLGDAIYADTRDSVEMFQIYPCGRCGVCQW